MKFFINLTVAMLLSGSFVLAQTTTTKGKVSGTILDEKSTAFSFCQCFASKSKRFYTYQKDLLLTKTENSFSIRLMPANTWRWCPWLVIKKLTAKIFQ